jgi:protein-L-isoaspartate(D-aspartate) O-methyltransferase
MRALGRDSATPIRPARSTGYVLALLLAVLAASLAVPAAAQRGDAFAEPRRRMVEDQIARRGISAPTVLRAMNEVPRHLFVPEALRDLAYDDRALPIGNEQNILQPYLVALMADLLELDGTERVLEIGTGTGYQAAVLSRIAGEVYTVEIVDDLADRARGTLLALGYGNVRVRAGDGYKGWPEVAPFDAILVTAAPERVPQPLLDQLKLGGRMVIPVGSFFQDLTVITRTADGFEKRKSIPVRLEPMTGQVQVPPPTRP